MMTIEEMRARKRELGYTYELLSQVSGVPLGTVQKVLGGVTKSPRYETILALERALSAPREKHGSGTIAQPHTSQEIAQPQEMSQVQEMASLLTFGDSDDGRDSVLREPGAGYGLQTDGQCAVGKEALRPQAEVRHAVGQEIVRASAERLQVEELQAVGQQKRADGFTLADYYALPDESRAELIDGKIYDMSAPSAAHQLIGGEIFGAFRDHIRRSGGSCIPLYAPVDVQLDQDEWTMVQPDVLILCDREKLHRDVIYGAPDLVVEILSKSTLGRDLIIKLNKYYQAGVREYWIVDPSDRKIRVYQFAGEELAYQEYEGTDAVPVGIWDGACRVDFAEIFTYLDALDGLQM